MLKHSTRQSLTIESKSLKKTTIADHPKLLYGPEFGNPKSSEFVSIFFTSPQVIPLFFRQRNPDVTRRLRHRSLRKGQNAST